MRLQRLSNASFRQYRIAVKLRKAWCIFFSSYTGLDAVWNLRLSELRLGLAVDLVL